MMIEVGKSYRYTQGSLKGAIDKVLEVDRDQRLVKIIVVKGRDSLEAIQASEKAGSILYEPGCKYTLDLVSYENSLDSGEKVEVT